MFKAIFKVADHFTLWSVFAVRCYWALYVCRDEARADALGSNYDDDLADLAEDWRNL